MKNDNNKIRKVGLAGNDEVITSHSNFKVKLSKRFWDIARGL